MAGRPGVGYRCASCTGGIAVNVRDAFYEILCAHGITTVFGNPGSNELPHLIEISQRRLADS